MSFSEETLMAYADGELDEPTRSAVERAIRTDPSVAAKVRQHQALRSNVFAAFSPIMDEPIPSRLNAAAKPGKVIHLNTVRAARTEAVEKRRWSWPEWGAIAATLVVGVLAGSLGLKGMQGESQLASVAAGDGTLVAQGKLADALSHQLASATTATSEVKIGVSFVGKDGNYCRSFMMGVAAGVACRSGAEWKVPLMAEAAAGAAGAYRQAGSEMPAAVMEAIDQRIAGQALDSKEEQAARQQGWKR
jgi:hypothetical protein